MTGKGLSAGTVARQLGVAVTTLRTWHQRYGLGPSQHVPGHHRRYTPSDLARLEVMRRLTAEGVAPAEAARWANQGPTADAGGEVRLRTARDGGGQTIPVGRTGPAARGLARAAVSLDSVTISETIEQSLERNGVIATWDDLLRPVLAAIGERHAATAGLIEVEHLMSRCVSEAFAAVARAGKATSPPRILLSCADEEQHTLPLEALAAALPRRPLLVLAAGPGWRVDTLPSGVVRPANLTEAVSLALAVRDSWDQLSGE